MRPRPRDVQTERAGAVFGGAVGYGALVAFDLLIGERLLHGGSLPGRADRWLELSMSWLLITGFGGALFGLIGGRLAVKFRDWRHRDWTDFRTAAVGGFVAATAAAAVNHLP